jgi:SAM-dependent methyltransferase
MNTTPYHDGFFDLHEQGALESARVIVPILLSIVKPTSVIDVGCGRGTWLKVFQENGVKTIRGLDGRYIDRLKLLIDPIYFSPVDLSEPLEIDGQYDLAVCLEVAEHIAPKNSRPLIRTLTAAAPAVLFSAAIPGQSGTDHVNEQWPSYWKELFAERGFQMLDPIRRHILLDTRVEWWYRQNIVLFASEVAISKDTVLRKEETAARREFEWVHVDVLRRHRNIRYLLRETPRAAWRKIHRSFRKVKLR